MKSRTLPKKLKNTSNKIKKPEKESKLRMLLKAIVLVSIKGQIRYLIKGECPAKSCKR